MKITNKIALTKLNSNEIKLIQGGTSLHHTEIGTITTRIDPSISTDGFSLPMPRPPKKRPKVV